jgi:hypothetical protein
MMEGPLDPWRKKADDELDRWGDEPDWPPAPIYELDEPEAPKPAAISHHWLSGAAAVAMAVGIAGAFPQGAGEIKKAPSAQQAQKHRQTLARARYIKTAVKRAALGEYGYCDPPQDLLPRVYDRRDILEFNNRLRVKLGLSPLKEDSLLDNVAQQTANKLARHPVPISEFQPPAIQNGLALQGIEKGRWDHVETEYGHAANGQAAEAAGCIIDSRPGARKIKAASYIGIGSALSKTDRLRYLVIEYAWTEKIKNG